MGDDVNPCSRTAPCKTFAGAISKTAAGGEISVLDPGGFGAVTITKSITINGGGIEGSTLNSSTTGFIINGAGVDVVLRNLDVEGGTPGLAGLFGIRFIQGDSLLVENATIRNNAGGASPAGILFSPSGAAKLFVRNVALSGNGNAAGTVGAGIIIKPAAGGSASVALEHVFVARNAFGIAVDGSTSTAGINATIADSVLAGNSQDGIVATTGGGAPIGVMVKNSKVLNNAIGIRSIGAGATIRVDGSAVIGNGTGLSPSGGALLSFGNNNVEANGANGAFSGSVALK